MSPNLRRTVQRRRPSGLSIGAPIAAGTRVTVGPLQPATVARVVEGRQVPYCEAVVDGSEGDGVVVARDHAVARVRLDDERDVRVSLGRCRRA